MEEGYKEHWHLYSKKPHERLCNPQWTTGIFIHSRKVDEGLMLAEPISLCFTEHLTLHITKHPTSRQLRLMPKCEVFFFFKKTLKSSYIRKPPLPTFPPLPSYYWLPHWLQDSCVTTWEIPPIRCLNDFDSGVVISWVMVKSQSKLFKLSFFSGWFPHLVQSTPFHSFPGHIPRKLIRVAVWPKECEAQKLLAFWGQDDDQFLFVYPGPSCSHFNFLNLCEIQRTQSPVSFKLGPHHKKAASSKRILAVFQAARKLFTGSFKLFSFHPQRGIKFGQGWMDCPRYGLLLTETEFKGILTLLHFRKEKIKPHPLHLSWKRQ